MAARPDSPRPPVLAACGMAFEAALAAGPGVVALYGPGAARLAAVLAAQLGPGAVRWGGILSFGCAGGLDPGLAPGTCVLATGVQTAQGFLCADADWLRALARRLPAAVSGELAGIDAPLMTAADKAALWRAGGACAVDMESHAAALAARRHGLPFAACRVVLDPAWRSVPACAPAGMAADGTVAPGALLRALARAPGQLGPLCVLACDAWRARRALGTVRARLGERLALP
jgi:hopanoid-associated phosphorylase